MEPPEVRALLAENIRAAARSRGLSIERLADFAGVSRSQVFSVLAESTSPTVDWLTKVATALELEPSALLTPADAKRSAR